MLRIELKHITLNCADSNFINTGIVESANIACGWYVCMRDFRIVKQLKQSGWTFCTSNHEHSTPKSGDISAVDFLYSWVFLFLWFTWANRNLRSPAMNTQTSPMCIRLDVVGNWLFVTCDFVTLVLLVRTLNNRSEDTLSPSSNNPNAVVFLMSVLLRMAFGKAVQISFVVDLSTCLEIPVSLLVRMLRWC